MKVIIDLIEDIRESIANAETYRLMAGLLKEDGNDPSKLVYAGEAPINGYTIDHEAKQLRFFIDGSENEVLIGDLIPELLILDMDAMMYELRLDVNAQFSDMKIVGFGKNDEEQRYVIFIKI